MLKSWRCLLVLLVCGGVEGDAKRAFSAMHDKANGGLLLGTAMGGEYTMRTKIDRWLAEGQALLDHHDNALALIPLERVLHQASVGPASSQAWRLKSESLEHLGHLDQALAAANRAVEDAPDAMRGLAQRAHIYDLLKRYPEALVDCTRALTLSPTDVRLWIMLGVFYTHGRNDAEALNAFEGALALDGEHAEAWNGKAIALEHLGQLDAALTAFEYALQTTPKDAPAYAMILVSTANVLYGSRRLPEAQTLLEQVIQLDSAPLVDRANAWKIGGDILVEQHSYDEALAHYEQALALAPENARVWDAKGFVLYQFDQPKAAITAYDEALRLDPARLETQKNRRYALARLLLAQRPRLDLTAPAFLEVDDSEVWWFEAQRQARLRHWRDAEAAADQMLRVDPNGGLAPQGKALKSFSLLMQKRFRAAAATFRDGWQASKRKNQRQRAEKARSPHETPPPQGSD